MKKAYLYTGSGSAIDHYNNPKSQLQDIVNGVSTTNQQNWGFFDKDNQQHRTILSQLRSLDWVTQTDNNRQFPDILRLSDFLKSDKSPINKPLKRMTQQELSKIISCFDSMINKKNK